MRRSILVYGMLPICFWWAGLTGQMVIHTQPNITAQEASSTLSADLARLIDLGLHNAVADFFWIRTHLDSDLEHYEKRDLNSWMFRRFEFIQQLDPLFYENYLYGGQYLMIVKDDLSGAENLLSRGLKYYPKDISLNWHMGFLYIYEIREPAKALPYFDVISKNPNRPPMFDSMYTRLKAQAVSTEDAFNFAYASWKKHPDDSPVKERLTAILYSLKAEIDLACLNGRKKRCETRDFTGSPYLNDRGSWKAAKPLIKTGISKNHQNAQ